MLCLRSSWTCRTATATATAPTSRSRTRHFFTSDCIWTLHFLLTVISSLPPPPTTLLKVSSFNLFRLVYFRSHLHCSHCGDLSSHGPSILQLEFKSYCLFPLSFGSTRFDQRCAVPVNRPDFYAVATNYIISLYLFTFLSKIQFILIVHSLWSAFNRTSIDIESVFLCLRYFPVAEPPPRKSSPYTVIASHALPTSFRISLTITPYTPCREHILDISLLHRSGMTACGPSRFV